MFDALHQKAAAMPTRQSDREKPRDSWHSGPAAVSHGLSNLPSLASSNDAVRASAHPTSLPVLSIFVFDYKSLSPAYIKQHSYGQ